MRFKHVIGCALGLATPEAFAADDGRSFLVIPGAFYGQETSLGFAAFGNATFPLRGVERPSSVSAAVVYTLRNQASFTVWPVLNLTDRWAIQGAATVSDYPTRWFGTGEGAGGTWQPYTRQWTGADLAVLTRVHGPVWAGVTDMVSASRIVEVGEPEVVDGGGELGSEDTLGTGAVLGEAGGPVHGLGLVARYDSRDNELSTRRGGYVDVRWLAHDPAIGSRYAFHALGVDARWFHTSAEDWTVAVRMSGAFRIGEPPFTHLAELGGDNLLRGVFQGRFRDRHTVGLQGELRLPVVRRLRAVGWADVGQAFHEPEELLERPVRLTVGAGARFEIDEEAHSVVRLDVGGGPDGFGLILNFGEAF